MQIRRQFAAAALAALTAIPAAAQDAPVTIVVPFAAGGSADAVARAVALGMSATLGQPVVVENKGGAAGLIGVTAVARAAPDGHTLMLTTDGIFANPALAAPAAQEALGKLVPVANLAAGPLAIATAGTSTASSLPEFIALMKNKGAPATYGVSGLGTTHHLAGEMLARAAGLRMTAVPYRGTSAAATDLAAGTIDLLIGNLTSIQPLVAGGRARLLAVTSLQPFKLAPTAPTVSQSYKGYEMTVGLGLTAPAGTPAQTIAKLSAAAKKALESKEVREQIYTSGMAPDYLDASGYGGLLKKLTATRTALVREMGITGK